MPEHISVDPKTALVEEIQAKVYDTAKSRVLTLLEVIMGGDNRPSGSAVNRLVGYLLQDIEDVIWAVAEKHGVDVSQAVVERARKARQQQERSERVTSIGERIEDLKRELAELELRKEYLERDGLIWEAVNLLEGAKPDTLRTVIDLLSCPEKRR